MMFDPLDTRGQERTREEQQRTQQQALETAEDDLKWLMGSRRGRRLMWWLLEQSPPRGDPFDTNALLMARKTGNQRLGMKLEAIAIIEFPELYLQMIKEYNDGNNGNTDRDSPKSN